MDLSALVDYLDGYLRIRELPDSSRALNGLQVDGTREVRRILAAVDASVATVGAAVRAEADLLLVHHGLFWDGNRPVTGRRYRKLAPLLQNGIAVYSAHIPLDEHPEVGNSAVLLRELGAELEGRFGDYEGVPLGVWGRVDLHREELAARLEELHGRPAHLMPGGSERVTRVGVMTGAGGTMIDQARAAGLDAYITGEGPHHTYFDAMEGGINVYYAGHYATETWGVRALADHLADRFGIGWEFYDHPTGL